MIRAVSSSKFTLPRRGVLLLSTLLTAATCAHPVTIPRPMSGNGAPPQFVSSTSDAKSTRVIAVREGLARPVAFRMATEALTQRYMIDVSDPNAGFLMTPWQATFTRNGVPELRYRTRVVVRFLGDDWGDLALRVEANWQRGEEWQVGYDEKLLDELAAELTTRLGPEVPRKTKP